MPNQRVCKGCFLKKMPNQRVCKGCFLKKMPNQRVCKGCFQNLMPIRRVCKGCFGKKHTSNVFFGEAFSQITPSRVVFGRPFFKPPFRALFLGGFSSKTAFPYAWKCCFRWEHVARLDVKNGEAHRDLFFLCGLFQSFASQLFSHVACFHIHVIDVFFAIVAARRAFATQHQRIGA